MQPGSSRLYGNQQITAARAVLVSQQLARACTTPQRPNLRISADGFRLSTPHDRTVASAPTQGALQKEKKS
jgi:hypothetical protein